ncbi:MAG: UDP-N-acetylmuramoyl-tripeptide--D-alanyl-D-alanine ligase [Bacteroidetes bacterium]|jgi:UDP-N-acetylmuramoyl-tripeptide--D-alanyl-D-alanine ligase|nr:UDP-N-acetylmuramoyl-tripeptide--D-alanyl-D-alanine ligase [Bacteroidota bacterium]MBX7237997.1 UDP-N-acetylmuramoyl-tripeptide--D-alanyl-D-alanine ligase [Bacteroidia bacterium]MCC7514032.1 UDP-N-acetylmuramoyl-tripeptide--D-alanyl-D-alanine ligase [Bacteroidia bacterium]HMU77541.1 UDP-N-acetylmuramoyl-tripeptide--D-alanyl-D-alanine ligase [Bacteroidia bacterium]HMW08802.1 UDP-N-acetylmuramoyl-tripeptide--D-alanyl-D-alanine ligase [Bacteroidia bacterium]
MIAHLHSLLLSSTGVCTDTRKLIKGNIYFALKGPSFDGNKFALQAMQNGALAAVVDDSSIKGENIYLVENVLTTLQHLATYHRQALKTPVIGLTGSNGKTTTKELISRVLGSSYNVLFTEGNLNNHIGVPLTLLRLNSEHQIAVIEMGANHQGEIQELSKIALPNFGLITNIGKAHLEGFGGIDGVIKGKTELYRHLMENDGVIFCRRNNELLTNNLNHYQKVIFYSTQPDVCIYGEISAPASVVKFNWFENHNRIDEITTHLTGDYNLENLVAAVCIGRYFNVTPEKIKSAIEGYIPENQRSQIEISGSNTIIIDAYNANPSSMEAALKNLSENYDGNKVIILGEMLELGQDANAEHQHIVDLLSSMEKDLLILVGENFLHTTLNDHALRFKTSEDACNYLQNHAINESTILVKGSRGSKMEKVLDGIRNHN